MVILLYHRILRNIREDAHSPYGVVRLSDFESQIDFLRKEFQLVSLEEWLRALREKKRNTKRLVSITFDDGWRDVWENGVPILQARRIPASFFLTTRFLEEGGIPWWEKLYFLILHPPVQGWVRALRQRIRLTKLEANDFLDIIQKLKTIPSREREELVDHPFRTAGQKARLDNERLFMSWEEARTLAKASFFTIGAHGINHECLTALPQLKILREVCHSKEILERRLTCQVHFFAYPFGSRTDVNDVAVHACRSSGFRAAFTGVAGVNSSSTSFFRLKRTPVDSQLPLRVFQAILRHPKIFIRE